MYARQLLYEPDSNSLYFSYTELVTNITPIEQKVGVCIYSMDSAGLPLNSNLELYQKTSPGFYRYEWVSEASSGSSYSVIQEAIFQNGGYRGMVTI